MGDDDEKMCECKEDQFKCLSGGGCVDLAQRCDGVAQCADQSDEWSCFRANSSSNIVEVNVSVNYKLKKQEKAW